MAQKCVQAAPVKAGAATGRPHRQGASSQVSMQDRTPLGEVAQQGHGFSTSHHVLPGDPVDQCGLWAQVRAGNVTRFSCHPDSMQEKYNNTTSQGWLLPSGPLLQPPTPQTTPAQPQLPPGLLLSPFQQEHSPSICGPEDTQDMTLEAATAAAGPGTHSPWERTSPAQLPVRLPFPGAGQLLSTAGTQPRPPSAEHVCCSHAHRAGCSDSHPKGRPSAGQGSLHWNTTPATPAEK